MGSHKKYSNGTAVRRARHHLLLNSVLGQIHRGLVMGECDGLKEDSSRPQ